LQTGMYLMTSALYLPIHQYLQATKRLEARRCERKSYYNTGESCSVWFEPGEVWEIRGADLTLSPVHKAAIGCIEANPERGVSLRCHPVLSSDYRVKDPEIRCQ